MFLNFFLFLVFFPVESLKITGFSKITDQIQQTFSIKEQVVNILCFAGHMVSVTTIQLCCCNAKNTEMHRKHKQMSPKNFFAQKQDLASGPLFANS